MRTYNSISYFINVTIGSIFHKNEIGLIEDQVSRIEIENSIGYRSPRVIVQFNDIDDVAGAYLHQTNCYLNLEIRLGFEKDPVITIKFLIDNVDILSITRSGTTYEISGVCDIEDLFTKSVNYSTVTGKFTPPEPDVADVSDVSGSTIDAQQKDPYEIINAVTSDAGIVIYNMKKDINVKPSKLGDPIDFITYAGMTIEDVIDFCLAKAVEKPDTPPAYLWHTISGKTYLLSRKDILEHVIKDINSLEVSFKENIKLEEFKRVENFQYNPQVIDNAREVALTDIKAFTEVGGLNNKNEMKERHYSDFDATTRTWSRQKITPQMISETVVNVNYKELESSLYWPEENFKKYIGFPNNYKKELYDHLVKLDLQSETIQFKIGGWYTRDVGSLINIQMNMGSIDSKYNGIWMITKINHKFLNQEYINDIICTRVSHFADKGESK